jgi:hypothetical protein
MNPYPRLDAVMAQRDLGQLQLEPRFVALLGEILFGGPWPGPDRGVFDRDLICERGRARARPMAARLSRQG